jgi:hypothetical protein
MREATQRSILRWIHIVFSIPILGYIYSPFEEIPKYADRVRFVVVPVMLLSGLWMWKGHVLRRLVLKRPVLRHPLSKQGDNKTVGHIFQTHASGATKAEAEAIGAPERG